MNKFFAFVPFLFIVACGYQIAGIPLTPMENPYATDAGPDANILFPMPDASYPDASIDNTYVENNVCQSIPFSNMSISDTFTISMHGCSARIGCASHRYEVVNTFPNASSIAHARPDLVQGDCHYQGATYNQTADGIAVDDIFCCESLICSKSNVVAEQDYCRNFNSNLPQMYSCPLDDSGNPAISPNDTACQEARVVGNVLQYCCPSDNEVVIK